MNLFAYGTLQFAAILEAVCGQRALGEPATLRGYRCEGVRGVVYPAIIRRPGEQVDGLLWRGLTATALGLLDAFEGTEYRRVTGRVRTRSGAAVPALFYVAAPVLRARLDGRPWDARRFATSGLPDYLAHCRRARRIGRRCGH